MKYYNGILYNKDNLTELKINIEFANKKVINMFIKNNFLTSEDDNRFEYLNPNDKKLLDTYVNNIIDNKKDNININSILLKMYKDKLLITNDISSKSIIYEKIIDEENNLYAKEIISGITFPISKDFDIESKVMIEDKVDKKECFVNIDEDSRNVITVESVDRDSSSYFYGKKDSIYHIIPVQHMIDDDDYILEQIPDKKRNFELIRLGTFAKCHMRYLTLSIKPNILFSNLELGKIYVDEKSIANNNEIENYKDKYQNKFGNKHKYKRFINELTSFSKENVYKGEIIPKKEEIKEHIEQNDLTKLMEQIEYNLIILKNYSLENYQKYSNKYNELLSSDTLKFPITKASLESILAGIEMCLKFEKNSGSNLLEYLENKKQEYLSNLLDNHIESTLTIDDIDKIMELYLKMQNEYNPINQRKITRNIALLYLLELIENKDNLDNIDIEKSYIKDLILTILIWINELNELKIINCDKLLDLSIKYSIDDTLDIIKSINSNNLNQELIKRL